MDTDAPFDNSQNDEYLELSSLTTAHLDLVDWLNYHVFSPATAASDPSFSPPSLSSAEARAWHHLHPPSASSKFPYSPASTLRRSRKDASLSFGKEYVTQDPKIQAKLLAALSASGALDDASDNGAQFEPQMQDGKTSPTTAAPHVSDFPSSSSLRNKNLRILDNLLLLTSEYIDDSHQSIYLIFSYLLRKTVEVCDGSSTWSWAEIYVRSFVRLIEQSRADHASKLGTASSGTSAPFSLSPFSHNQQTATTTSTSSRKSHSRREAKRMFHGYRTTFLVSLLSFLTCKMAEFDPRREPHMAKVFTHAIIPTLSSLCSDQADVCDTPGIALMYILSRIDIPIQDLIFKYRHATLYTNEHGKTLGADTYLSNPRRGGGQYSNDGSAAGSDDSLGFGNAGLSPCSGSAESRQPYTIVYQLMHPKDTMMSEDIKSVTFIPKFLQVFWLQSLAMGFYRRCWNRAGNDMTYLSAVSASLLSPFATQKPLYFPINNVHDANLTEKDEEFLFIFKKLVVDSYTAETDQSIRHLYALVFNIKRLPLGVSAESMPPSPLYLNGRDQVLYHSGYSLVLREYAEPKIYATSVELVRLIQNSLCRLIPRHVHLKFLVLSLFKVPCTAPAASLAQYYRKTRRLSAVAKSIVAVKKRAFVTSHQRAVFDRFVYYMPPLIWEGLVREERRW